MSTSKFLITLEREQKDPLPSSFSPVTSSNVGFKPPTISDFCHTGGGL